MEFQNLYEKYKYLINTFLKENYIILNANIYQQVNGIPQGGSASNSLANIYLHYYEEMYHEKNNNLAYLELFFRFIDDLIIFVDNLELKPNVGFYPEYLTLKHTNLTNIKVQFPNLDIDSVENKIITRIFDKRNYFKFNIVRFPYWNSNLHVSIFRNMLNFFIVTIIRIPKNWIDIII